MVFEIQKYIFLYIFDIFLCNYIKLINLNNGAGTPHQLFIKCITDEEYQHHYIKIIHVK